MKAGTRKFTACALIASVALQLSPARAEMLPASATPRGDRERIAALVEREEVRAQLEARGVDAAQAKARLGALSDEEAALLAAKLDTLPIGAGGNGAEVIAGVLMVVVLLPFVLIAAIVVAVVKSARASHQHGQNVADMDGPAPTPAKQGKDAAQPADGTDDAVALLNADRAPVPPSKPSATPVAGDTWTYRLTEPRGAKLHRVAVDGAAAESIGRRRNASYLVNEGELVLFSPYLIAFDPQLSGLPAAAIEAELPSCAQVWMCTVRARFLGKETVRVPAGQFEALKVEIEQAWFSRSPTQPGGARTLTIWYVPEAKRAVKFLSRGTAGAHFKTNFGLELENYRLN